jgi:hypothetical protein
LGIYSENGEKARQDGGAHMRLIVGYNFKDKEKPELIFSDSWGAGHEKKSMLLADAFAATTDVLILEPQK